MSFFEIDAEVPGGLGENSVLEHRQGRYPIVKRLHFAFSDWLGDDLLTGHPVYLVTDRLARVLANSGLSGFALARPDEVSRDGVWEQLHPDLQLPQVWWLLIDGEAGSDDFGLTGNAGLVVSERALEVLRRHHLNQAEVTRLG